MPLNVPPAGAPGVRNAAERTGETRTNTPAAKGAAPAQAKAWTANGKARPLADQPTQQLGSAVSLALAETSLGVATDGSLTKNGAAASSPEEWIRWAREAVNEGVKTTSLSSVFSAIDDPEALRAIATKAAVMHRALLLEPQDEAGKLERRGGRAAALSLIEAAALRASELGSNDVRDALTFGLVGAAKDEPHRKLRDFTLDRVNRGAEHSKLTPIGDAREALYPSKPPYDRWLKDGVVRMVQYADNDGALRVGQIAVFEELGIKRHSENPDGSLTLRRPAKDGKPAIEVILAPAPKKDAPPALFEKMGDPATDIILYSGHAGYGRRVEQAIASGVKGSGDGKLVMLMQCSGTNNVRDFNAAFPDAHLISSTASTDHAYDSVMLKALVDGIDKRHGYSEMRENAIGTFDAWKKARTAPGGLGLPKETRDFIDAHPMSKQYFYPNEAQLIRKYVDRDSDGNLDVEDDSFNIVYAKRIDTSGGYDPIEPGAPLDALDGRSLSSATGDLNLFVRYAELPKDLIKDLPWHSQMFQPSGFFQPARGETKAFRFERSGDAVKVSLSANFAHTPPSALARMLAIETGQFVGRAANLDPRSTAALTASMLERVVHQEGSMPRDEEEGRALMNRYGLPLGPDELKATTGDPEDFVADSYQRIASALDANPAALAAFANSTARRATKAVTFTPGIQATGRLNAADVNVVLKRLGIAGTAEPSTDIWFTTNGRTTVTVEGPNGPRRLHFAIDSEGEVRAVTEAH